MYEISSGLCKQYKQSFEFLKNPSKTPHKLKQSFAINNLIQSSAAKKGASTSLFQEVTEATASKSVDTWGTSKQCLLLIKKDTAGAYSKVPMKIPKISEILLGDYYYISDVIRINICCLILKFKIKHFILFYNMSLKLISTFLARQSRELHKRLFRHATKSIMLMLSFPKAS